MHRHAPLSPPPAEFPGETSARATICDAVRRLTGAEGVALWEHDARGEVVATASSGSPPLQGAAVGPGRAHTEPVRTPDGVYGVLAILWSEPPTPLSPALRDVISVLAGSAARAIEHDERVAALQRDARIDRLTGLPSDHAWREALDRELARAARGGEPPCVAVLAFDGFERYAERHGSAAGEALLRQASTRWRARVRGGDVLARLDRRRFGLLLPATVPAAGHAVTERLVTSGPDGQAVSAGVVLADARESADALLDRVEARRERGRHDPEAGADRRARTA